MKAIVQDGNPILRKEALPVPEKMFSSPELKKLIKGMVEALDKEPDGVALAAPQIGSPYRLFIVRVDRTLPPPPPEEGKEAPPPPPKIQIYVNPEITKTSRKRQVADEGCLSVRGIYGTTKRHEKVALKARREDGTRFTRGASGLLAQIFEHEVDHLNGALFIDHAEHLIEIKKKDGHPAQI